MSKKVEEVVNDELVNDEAVYEKKWYIIHTYSGYEKKVATDLEKRIESLNLTNKVFRILVPEEEAGLPWP